MKLATEISALIEHELRRLRDQRVLDHIRSLLVEPTVVMRRWHYSTEPKEYPCWAVMNHPASNSGIAYCEFGFGPRSPWGLVSLSGAYMGIGMDSDWFESFLGAYFDSPAVTELPIWRVFKREGSAYPGEPLTEESDWNSTWQEVYRLRQSDQRGRYHCDHAVLADPDET